MNDRYFGRCAGLCRIGALPSQRWLLGDRSGSCGHFVWLHLLPECKCALEEPGLLLVIFFLFSLCIAQSCSGCGSGGDCRSASSYHSNHEIVAEESGTVASFGFGCSTGCYLLQTVTCGYKVVFLVPSFRECTCEDQNLINFISLALHGFLRIDSKVGLLVCANLCAHCLFEFLSAIFFLPLLAYRKKPVTMNYDVIR